MNYEAEFRLIAHALGMPFDTLRTGCGDAMVQCIKSLRARAERAENALARTQHLHRTRPDDALDRATIKSVAEDGGFVHAADVLRLLADVEKAERERDARPNISAQDAAYAWQVRSIPYEPEDGLPLEACQRMEDALRAHGRKA